MRPGARKLLMQKWSIELTPKIISKERQTIAQHLPRGTRVFIPHLQQRPYGEVIDAALALYEVGMRPVPHIAVRRFLSHADADDNLMLLQEKAPVKEVLLVSGDFDTATRTGVADSVGFVRSGLMQQSGIRKVVMAAFPQPRPKRQLVDEVTAMHEKVNACRESGLELSFVTQLCFDTSDLETWIREVRRSPSFCELDFQFGLSGPADAAFLKRFSSMLGVSEKGLNLSNLNGQVTASAQLQAIRKAQPDAALHFYCFGDLEATVEWIKKNTS